jgi:hypothetical protein
MYSMKPMSSNTCSTPHTVMGLSLSPLSLESHFSNLNIIFHFQQRDHDFSLTGNPWVECLPKDTGGDCRLLTD